MKWVSNSRKKKREQKEKKPFDYRNPEEFAGLVKAVVIDMGRRLIGKSGRVPNPPSAIIVKQTESGKQEKTIGSLIDMSPSEAMSEIHAECDETCLGLILLFSIVLREKPARLWIHTEHITIPPKEMFYIEKNRTFHFNGSLDPMVRLMQMYNPSSDIDMSGILEKIEYEQVIPRGGRGTGVSLR